MKENKVISAFNSKEKFEIDNIPKHFESVTNASIGRLKASCLKRIEEENNGEYSPAALKASLQSINGKFDTTYATLEGDYGTRRANLKAAYSTGVAELEKDFNDFRLELSEHDRLFKRYSDIANKLEGKPLSDDLVFPKKEIEEMATAINKLERKK